MKAPRLWNTKDVTSRVWTIPRSDRAHSTWPDLDLGCASLWKRLCEPHLGGPVAPKKSGAVAAQKWSTGLPTFRANIYRPKRTGLQPGGCGFTLRQHGILPGSVQLLNSMQSIWWPRLVYLRLSEEWGYWRILMYIMVYGGKLVYGRNYNYFYGEYNIRELVISLRE